MVNIFPPSLPFYLRCQQKQLKIYFYDRKIQRTLTLLSAITSADIIGIAGAHTVGGAVGVGDGLGVGLGDGVLVVVGVGGGVGLALRLGRGAAVGVGTRHRHVGGGRADVRDIHVYGHPHRGKPGQGGSNTFYKQ